VISLYILASTDENSFDLDSVDKVPNIRANVAEDVQVWPKRSLSLRLSLSACHVKSNIHTALITKNTTENNRILSHAQATTAQNPSMFK